MSEYPEEILQTQSRQPFEMSPTSTVICALPLQSAPEQAEANLEFVTDSKKVQSDNLKRHGEVMVTLTSSDDTGTVRPFKKRKVGAHARTTSVAFSIPEYYHDGNE